MSLCLYFDISSHMSVHHLRQGRRDREVWKNRRTPQTKCGTAHSIFPKKDQSNPQDYEEARPRPTYANRERRNPKTNPRSWKKRHNNRPQAKGH